MGHLCKEKPRRCRGEGRGREGPGSFAGIRKGEGGVSLKKWAWSKVGRVLREKR